MLVATPSGLTLAPEGGAHQSINTPLIGIGQPGLADLRAGLCRRARGADALGLRAHAGRTAARSICGCRPAACEQPRAHASTERRRDIMAGGYWMPAPARGADIAIVYQGAVAPEAIAAFESVARGSRRRPAGDHLARTGCTPLARGAAQARPPAGASTARRADRAPAGAAAADAALVTVLDGHPAALSWLGAVRGQRVVPLGVDHFGQSGDIPDLYRDLPARRRRDRRRGGARPRLIRGAVELISANFSFNHHLTLRACEIFRSCRSAGSAALQSRSWDATIRRKSGSGEPRSQQTNASRAHPIKTFTNSEERSEAQCLEGWQQARCRCTS